MTRPESTLGDLVGEQFGPYRLVSRLGIGGMAETYEAIRSGPQGFELHVCLKLVLPFLQQDPRFIELFHREARLAAKLNHSNIVRVMDFGEVQGRSYMALQLVDGCDLRALLDAQDRTRLLPEYVALIGLDLAAALEHAHNPSEGSAGDESGSHTHGIVHRDISPSNVLISRRGEVLLTDFGVAKAMTGTAHQPSAVKGKIAYMSPEQLKGETLDGRSDLFALGVVMFEALSGRRPFEGPSDHATILLTVEGEHPSLRSLVPDAPKELTEIIESLLDKDLTRRPQTAMELVELLDDFTPARRARRKLGKMVAAAAGARDSGAPEVSSGVEESKDSGPSASAPERSGVGPATYAVADPEAPTVPVTETELSVPEVPTRRRAVIAWLAAAIGAIAWLAWWLAQSGEDGPPTGEGSGETDALGEGSGETERPSAAPGTESPSPAPQDLEAEPAPPEPAPPEPPPEAELPPARPPAPARLNVVVFPWGDVWIDGQAKGVAPLKNVSLKPGPHKISVGQGKPSKTQTIRLRPGQRRTVRFDLTTPSK